MIYDYCEPQKVEIRDHGESGWGRTPPFDALAIPYEVRSALTKAYGTAEYAQTRNCYATAVAIRTRDDDDSGIAAFRPHA